VLAGVERIQEMLQLITRATREQTSSSGGLERAAEQMQIDSEQTTGAFAAQANQIRNMVQTMEHMAERIGAIALQTRAQQGEVSRLGQGISDVHALAEGFSGEARRLEAAMSAIASDIATLTSQVEHYKIS
jgi:methyl-accepting chemotaxis protein